MQFAIVNSSSLDDGDVAFMVDACDRQLKECADAWDTPYVPAAFYIKGTPLPADDVFAVEILDDLDAPGALGYHDTALGFPYARVEAQGPATSVTLSHELLETLVDPSCERWSVRRDGLLIAVEVGDPVEEDTYGIPATVVGVTKPIDVSNYILPAWFVSDAAGPYDRMQRLTAPWSMTSGGYMLTKNDAGVVSNVFAQGRPKAAAMVRRLRNPRSRMMRRLRAA